MVESLLTASRTRSPIKLQMNDEKSTKIEENGPGNTPSRVSLQTYDSRPKTNSLRAEPVSQ